MTVINIPKEDVEMLQAEILVACASYVECYLDFGNTYFRSG
jgi:hypothetical protein